MSININEAVLLGRLGRDPDIRTAQDGSKIANLNVATSRRWRDKQTGEKKEKTNWHRVVIFNPHLAEIAEKFLKKGSEVYLKGANETRKWIDNQGVERYVTEVVLGRFDGELQLGDTPGRTGGVPPAVGEGDYGTVRDVGGTGNEPPPNFDDPPFPIDERDYQQQ